MDDRTRVIEYKCPCCDAGLVFDSHAQKLTCEYCDNTFDMDTVRAYNDNTTQNTSDQFSWASDTQQEWTDSEQRPYFAQTAAE